MSRRPSPRPLPTRGAWWRPFAAGLAAGLVGGILLGRRPPGPLAWPRLAGAWNGAARRLGAMAETLRDGGEFDLERTRERLEHLPGGEGLRLRALTEGILEVVGTAPDAARARAVLDALSAEPGVRAVVNRIWTPSSGAHGGD